MPRRTASSSSVALRAAGPLAEPSAGPSAGADYGFVEAYSLVRGIWRTGCTSWPCCGC